MTSATGPTRRTKQSGLTLIELVLVMTLTLTLLAMAAPRLNVFSRGQVLRSNAERVLAMLRTARDRSVARAVTCTVTLEDRTLTLTDGTATTLETAGETDSVLELPESITVTMTSPQGQSLTRIDFTPTGETTPATIALTDAHERTLYVFARTAQETFAMTDEQTETLP